MRILLITPFSCDDPTFLSIFRGLAKVYRERGHAVVMAGRSRPSSRAPARERTAWGETRRLGGGARSSLAANAAAFFQLLFLLRRVDLVHLHLTGEWTPLTAAVWLACAASGAPLGVTFQDYANPFARPARGWELAVLKRLLLRARWVTALTSFIKDELERSLPPVRARVVPNGFDPREQAAARAGLGEGRPFVLCVARQEDYKGIDVLLMAWKDVCDELDGVDLLLCGPPASPDSLPGLAHYLGISGRVRFLGVVEREGVWALLRSCLFFVLPSRHEAFGIAALEAMASGKAVLATRTGGLPEMIEDGETGLLVAPKDVEALRAGLLRLLREPRLRENLGGDARKAAARYQWEAVADAYLAL